MVTVSKLITITKMLIAFAPALLEAKLCCAAPRELVQNPAWTLVRPDDGAAALVSEAASGLPGGASTELRATVSRPVDPFYGIQITAPLTGNPEPGDEIRFSFWARAAGRNSIRAVIETAGSPWTGVTYASLVLSSEWTHYTLQDVAQSYDQPLAARLQIGASGGVMEFAGLKVEDLGPDPEIAAERAAIAPAAVEKRILRYRMGSLMVRVVDGRGHPVADARVHVAMQRHAFLFGCNFFGFDPGDDSPGQSAYRARFAALFNYATLPFYWGAFEPEAGKPQFPRVDAMIDWCLAHGITPKGHPLVWHEVYPGCAPADPDTAIPILKRRVTEIVTRERGRIAYYDIVNEAANASSFAHANGESRWVARDGAAAVVETALGWGCSAGGGHETFIDNDYDTGSPNVSLLTRMQKDGRLPDAIGIQSHMHAGVWPMEKVWHVCETFARFRRPIHFTETTVLSGPKRDVDFDAPPATDWDSTPDGEQEQADYVVRFYSVLFSHPALRAITWWDFSDRNAWLGAPAGLVRRDMSPKPAYDRLMQLIHHDWWTDASGSAGRDGSYRLRAFYGDYRITAVDSHGHSVTRSIGFPEGAGPTTVTLSMP